MRQAFVIAFKNLRNFAAKHKLIFIITLFTLVLASVTTIYVFVKYDSNSDYFGTTDLELNNIVINCKDKSISIQEARERFERFSDKTEGLDIILACFYESDGNLPGQAFVLNEKEQFDKLRSKELLIRGRYIEDEDLEKGNDVVLASFANSAEERTLNTDLGGNKYEWIGDIANPYQGGSYRFNKLIPMRSAEKHGLIPNVYDVYFDHECTVDEMIKKTEELRELFPELEVTNKFEKFHNASNNKILADDNDLSRIKNIMLIIMVVIALLSCAYMYSYIINLRIEQICIFKICGATKGKLTIISIAELFYMLMIQFVPSILISRFVLLNLLRNDDPMYYYVYSSKHVAVAFGVITLCALLIYIPLLICKFSKTAVQLRQERK